MISYKKSSAVSKKTKCYKSRKFHFNNDDEYKSLTTYDDALRTCGNKRVANFKTNFNVKADMVVERGQWNSDEQKVYDESMENIRLVCLVVQV